jgi:hypothetical protein
MVRTRHVFVVALVVSFLALSLVSEKRARTFTGNVLAWRAGEYIEVSPAPTDPRGFQIGLRRNTIFEGDTAAIRPGVPVTVWYRNVGERRLMADRVVVLWTTPQ